MNILINIVRILEKQDDGSFITESVFANGRIHVTQSGKMRMAIPDLSPGDECVIQQSPFDLTRGRVATGTTFKMAAPSNNYSQQYAVLRQRYEEEIGPYETDQFWIKKAT